MKTAVVTGCSGQQGSYLAEWLLGKGYLVYGLAKPSDRDTLHNLKQALADKNFVLVRGDLLDDYLPFQLATIEPDEFYHLGAFTHVGDSFHNPTLVMETNVGSTTRILDALHKYSPDTRFYFAGSSEMFPNGGGRVLPWIAGDVCSSLGAHSPYAASKVAGFLMTQVYREAHHMYCVGGIAYNNESPRRPATFVTQKIVQGVKRFKATGERVVLGNVDAHRDWHHSKDTVVGMWLALQQDVARDYIFASGEAHSVKDFALAVCAREGVKYEDAITTSPLQQRPWDVPFLLGDPSETERVIGWKRQYTFNGLVEDMCRD
jgi:GDPmannose 4,6-dehydratase